MNLAHAIHPIDTPLDQLVEELNQAKADEEAAKAARLRLEERVLAHPDIAAQLKEEGTTSCTTAAGKLSVTTGFTRAWDQAELDRLAKMVSPEFWPFKAEWKEDRKASRTFEERWPDLWAELRQALTLKPRKPTVTVKP